MLMVEVELVCGISWSCGMKIMRNDLMVAGLRCHVFPHQEMVQEGSHLVLIRSPVFHRIIPDHSVVNDHN